MEKEENTEVVYKQYEGEKDLQPVMQLIDNELSEPYTIFTYRYFLHNWPNLCFLAYDAKKLTKSEETGEYQFSEAPFGTIVCKADMHGALMRGYIAMLVVENEYRGKGIGSKLVRMSIEEMRQIGCHEAVLEAEVTNAGALKLYQKLGFIRDKRLRRYYMNGGDAFRLKLMFPSAESVLNQHHEQEMIQMLQGVQELNVDTTNLQQTPA
eukprot:TRINITY_DN807_c0_g1_i3.p4 TRINITY_DN807_c0_g1~~TRINITY_DN807_c0_g1_i3.p4  ORF type:complete len:209 (+),score=34.64 TRINITY_DN807_c0_g1_i3:194-820(+)